MIFRQLQSSSRYVTHRHNFEIQKAIVSKRRMLLSWKVVNKYKFGTLLCLMGLKPLVAP